MAVLESAALMAPCRLVAGAVWDAAYRPQRVTQSRSASGSVFTAMSDLSFSAEPRTILGKQVKQLRRAGQVPGVVYGPAIRETVAVSVNRRDFDRFYRSAGHATLFTLRWGGSSQAVFIREVQQDPVRHDPIHIDFFAPRLDQPVRAIVPLVLHHPDEHAEGVLSQQRTDVEVEALPHVIPHQVDADITGLTAVGDTLRAGELKLPEGVTLITAEDELIAQISAETVETAEEAAEAVAAGAEAGAEAEDETTAEADAPAEDAAEASDESA